MLKLVVAFSSKIPICRATTNYGRAVGVVAPQDYQLSEDFQRKQVEMLERKYGGRIRTQRAATVIQRAFREDQIAKRWKQVRRDAR